MTAALTRPTDEELARAAALATDLGRVPTSNEIRAALGVGRDVANRVRAELDHSTTGHPGATDAGRPARKPVQLSIGMDGEVEEAPDATDTEAGTDGVARDDQAATGHSEATTGDGGPDGIGPDADADAAPEVARALSLVTGGGPPAGHPADDAGHPGPEQQATGGQLDDDAEPHAITGDVPGDEQATSGPVVDLAGHPVGQVRATPAVDGPDSGPETADRATPEADHSPQQAIYGPVATGAGHLVRWLRTGLFVIALPAFVATWSGWVGVGELTGFGPVNLLPGFGDGLTVNSAITLPLGVEAYVALAMGAWLSGVPMAAGARRFAMVSSLISLSLGMGAQVAYHLIVAGGAAHAAPWGVTVVVSCLPNLVMGMAAALIHLLRKGKGYDGE
jgi:hypothetical protein